MGKLRDMDAGGLGAGTSGRSRIDPTEEELQSMSAYTAAAVASGYVDADDVADIYDKSNLVQKVMGWTGYGEDADRDGSVLETVEDVLYLPVSLVYAGGMQKAAAQRKAANQVAGGTATFQDYLGGLMGVDFDAIEERGLLNAKFGVQTAVEAWRNKSAPSTFIRDAKLFDSGAATFGAGLAADIAFDPTTYLTFGIGAGTKVALSAASKAALRPTTRLAAEAGKALTLTRFGKRVYQEAVRDLAPRFLEEAAPGAAHLADAPIGARWHQEATDLMVQNFETYKARVLAQSRKGLWGRLKTSTPLTEAGRLQLQETVAQSTRKLAGLTADELFQESSTHGLELGLYQIPKAQKYLAGLKLGQVAPQKLLSQELAQLNIGRPLRWVFDTFDRGWDAPPDVVEQARLAFYASNDQLAKKVHTYYATFAKIPKEERELISEVIEARAGLTPTIRATLSEEAERAVEFFTTEMDDILRVEKEAGFETERAAGYVTHLYNINPNVREIALGVLRKNGEVDPKAFNRFSQQRLIASIAEGEEVLGEGALIKDAYQLLVARKKASLDLIHRSELYRYVAEKHGTPAAIIHATQQGASKGLVRGFFRRAMQGSHEVINVGQVYQATSGALKKLGFREADHAYNRQLLRYLQRPLTEEVGGRLSVDGLKEAETLGINEEAQLWQVEKTSTSPVKGISSVKTKESVRATPLPTKFRPIAISSREAVGELGRPVGVEQVRRQGPDFEVDQFLDMLESPKHVGWDNVFAGATGRNRLNWDNLRSVAYGFHRFMVKNLNTQLPGFIPDLDQKLYQAVREHAIRHRLYPANAKAAAKYDDRLIHNVSKMVAKMSGDIEFTHLEPQLPESFIRLAKATREAAGVLTDRVAPAKEQLQEIRKLAAGLGFTNGPFKKFVRLLTGEDSIQTIHQADLVHEALRHWTEKPAVGKGGQLSLRGEPVVKVGITFQRSKDLPLPELTSQTPYLEGSAGKVVQSAAEDGPALAQKKGRVELLTKKLEGLLKKQEELNAKTSAETFAVTEAHVRESAAIKPLKQRVKAAREALEKIPRNDAARKAAKEKLTEAQVELQRARAQMKGVAKSTTSPEITKARQAVADAKKAVADADPDSLARKAARARLRQARALVKAETEKLAEKGSAAAAVKDVNVEAKQALDPAKVGDASLAEVAKDVKGQKLGPVNSKLNDEIQKLRDQLFEAQKGLDEASVEKVRFEGGGVEGGAEADLTFNPGRRLEEMRARLKAATTPEEIAAAKRDLEQVRSEVPDPSRPRVSRSPVTIDYYVPESVGKLLRDLETPSIDPRWPELAKRMVRAYDRFLSMMKSNLMLPHGGYHMRNLGSNIAINYLAPGASLLDPTNGFKNMSDWMKVSLYSLYRHTNLGDTMLQDRGRVTKAILQWGEDEIVASNGRAIKVKDLVEEMGIRGTLSGTSAMDILDSNLSSRASGVIGGVGAGAAIGALGAGLAGSLAGAMGAGQNAQQPAQNGVGWSSLAGAAIGAALGGRGLAGASKAARGWAGGIPLRTADGVTALLQSNWKPLLAVGDAVVESPGRMALYLKTFKDTGSHYEAGRRVMEHMNDLFHMSAFERQVAKRIVPFYSWLKTSLRQSSHSLLENPSGIQNIYKFMENWNGGEDDEPDFLREKFTLLGRAPWGDSRATSVYAPGVVPMEDLMDIASPLVADRPMAAVVDQFLKRGPMGITSALEYAINRDSFTRSNITPEPGEYSRFERGKDWETAPGWLRTLVRYQPATDQQKSRVHPGIAWLIGELPVSRFMAFTRQAYDAGGKINPTILARQFLGVTAYRFDPETQTYYENRRKIERMARLLDNAGQIRKFERYYQKKAETR